MSSNNLKAYADERRPGTARGVIGTGNIRGPCYTNKTRSPARLKVWGGEKIEYGRRVPGIIIYSVGYRLTVSLEEE